MASTVHIHFKQQVSLCKSKSIYCPFSPFNTIFTKVSLSESSNIIRVIKYQSQSHQISSLCSIGLKYLDISDTAEGLKDLDISDTAEGLKDLDISDIAEGLKDLDISDIADMTDKINKRHVIHHTKRGQLELLDKIIKMGTKQVQANMIR